MCSQSNGTENTGELLQAKLALAVSTSWRPMITSLGKNKTNEKKIQPSHYFAEGLPLLLLLRHVLGHPLLVPTQLVVPFDLQKLHLLFASVPLPLQPHELMCTKKNPNTSY